MKKLSLSLSLIVAVSAAFAQTGNVGIGTTTPGTPLHVVGAVSSTSASTTAGSTEISTLVPGNLELFRSTSSFGSNANGFIDFKDNNSKDFDLRLIYDHTLGTNGGFQIVTSNSGGGSPAARLTVLNSDGRVGIGTATPHASAALDVSSSTQGVLVPRVSTSQRTAIISPAKGLMVFDSTINSFYYYNGSSWSLVGDNLGNHTATQNLNLGSNSLVGNGGNHGISIDQFGHVDIGSAFSFANTSLQVDSGFTIKQISVPISSGSVTIPDNISQVEITGTATFTVGVFTYPLNAGQQLTIWNHTSGGYAADVYASGANVVASIPNGQYVNLRAVGGTIPTYMPEAIYNNHNVRVISGSSFVNMLAGDYMIKFTGSGTYCLDNANNTNAGRTVCFYVGCSSCFPTVTSCGTGSIVNTGGTSTTSSLNLSSGNRVMLVSDGSNWIRIQ